MYSLAAISIPSRSFLSKVLKPQYLRNSYLGSWTRGV